LPGQPGLGRKSSGEWQDDENGEQKVKRAISSYANQPIGLFPGLRSARRNLERDLLIAKDAFVAVQGEILDSSSPGAAARAVARHAPIVILRPVIGATRAVGTALLGVGNQIDRENLRRVEDVSLFLPAPLFH
jgi:autophagy-related protein 2